MRRSLRACLIGCVLLLPTVTLAGPPFLNDDPDPVDYQHNEFYVFSILDHTADETSTSGPAFEYNRGVWPNVQFHIILPLSEYSAPGVSNAGLGDMEIGIKYRFIQEDKHRPMVGIFPMIEAATGDASRGLGNGQTWYHLPVWLQKSWGMWSSYGGGGVNVEQGDGMQNSWFAGWQLQRQLSADWMLGAELWHPSADTVGGQDYPLLNAGGFYHFTDSFQLLYTMGTSIAGEKHTVAYLGLYWTWGPKGTEASSPPVAALDPRPRIATPLATANPLNASRELWVR